MVDDTPEEDKHLKERVEFRVCEHEWLDFGGGAIKRGDPTTAVIFFYCKKCLKIRHREFDQSMLNLEWDDEHRDYRDR